MTIPSAPGRAVLDGPRPRRSGCLPVEPLESRRYQPAVRPGVVSRPQLLARLREARDVPTVAVVAPAGYGTTTLLALWAEADDPLVPWLSLDRHDDDPIVLLTHLAVALDRVGPLPAEIARGLHGHRCERAGSGRRRRVGNGPRRWHVAADLAGRRLP